MKTPSSFKDSRCLDYPYFYNKSISIRDIRGRLSLIQPKYYKANIYTRFRNKPTLDSYNENNKLVISFIIEDIGRLI